MATSGRATRRPVSDFIDHDVNGVGLGLAARIGADDLVGEIQFDSLAAIGQRAAIIAQGIGRGQVRIIGAQMGGVFRDEKRSVGISDLPF